MRRRGPRSPGRRRPASGPSTRQEAEEGGRAAGERGGGAGAKVSSCIVPSCATSSRWQCGSRPPGITMRPRASISSRPRARPRPTAAMTPSFTPRSASTTSARPASSPPRTTRSYACSIRPTPLMTPTRQFVLVRDRRHARNSTPSGILRSWRRHGMTSRSDQGVHQADGISQASICDVPKPHTNLLCGAAIRMRFRVASSEDAPELIAGCLTPTFPSGHLPPRFAARRRTPAPRPFPRAIPLAVAAPSGSARPRSDRDRRSAAE